MTKTSKNKKPSLKKVLFEYGLHLWLLLFIANVVIFYVAQYHVHGQTCFTTAQIQSDTRCLYILNNKVYSKGSRSSPHQGHPCGSDVTSVIPASHTNDAVNHLDPNYVGDICAATTPTPSPSPTPTISPTPQPSTIPSPQCLGSCISPGASVSAIPSLAIGSGSASGKGFGVELLTLLLLFFKVLADAFGVGGH